MVLDPGGRRAKLPQIPTDDPRLHPRHRRALQLHHSRAIRRAIRAASREPRVGVLAPIPPRRAAGRYSKPSPHASDDL